MTERLECELAPLLSGFNFKMPADWQRVAANNRSSASSHPRARSDSLANSKASCSRLTVDEPIQLVLKQWPIGGPDFGTESAPGAGLREAMPKLAGSKMADLDCDEQ